MGHDVVGQIHVRGVEHEAGLGADGVAAESEVARDVALAVLVPIGRLLDDRVDVALEGLDEPALKTCRRGLNGIEPVSESKSESESGKLSEKNRQNRGGQRFYS